MTKNKKTAMLVAGGMMALGVLAYCMLPREDKYKLKGMVDDLSMKNTCLGDCCCMCDK